MRPILLVELDTARPAVLLTRELVAPLLNHVTIAPITTTIRGIGSELPVGRANGLDQESVVSCDNVTTIDRNRIIRQIGSLLPSQETDLTRALEHAFDLQR